MRSSTSPYSYEPLADLRSTCATAEPADCPGRRVLGRTGGGSAAESLAAVSLINDSYGLSDVQRILERISQGSSTEAALRATIHSDYGQLESDLARYLADRYGD